MATPQQQYAQPPAGYPMPQYNTQSTSDMIKDISTAQGVNIDYAKQATRKLIKATGFVWKDAPYLWYGDIFPSEFSYHSLVENSDYELASTMLSLQGSDLPEQEKERISKQIERIVCDSYYLKTVNRVNSTHVVCVIAIIALICVSLISEHNYYVWLLIPVVVIILNLIYYKLLWGYDEAKSKGFDRWSTFMTNFRGKLDSGSTPKDILDDYQKNEKTNIENLQKKYDNVAPGYSTNMSLAGSNPTNTGLLGLITGLVVSKTLSK